MIKADVVIGLQYGDEAKAKCTYSLIENDTYSHVIRFNGGPNAGHTIYHNGRKMVTHQVPVGVFFDIPSIIGPGCVVDYDKLLLEVDEISSFLGKDITNLVGIDRRAHIITDEHKALDIDGSKIGSTKSGIAYAYRDKHQRTGFRYGDLDIHKFDKVDVIRLFYLNDTKILFEGAQGFGLDIDFGDYPYVTSSHCGIAGVIASGLRPDCIHRVYGVAKVYETYVGNKEFQTPNDSILEKLQEIGQEIGATTGRKRQCNYLNLDMIINSCLINQVSGIVLNKLDILREIGVFRCYYQGSLFSFDSENEFKDYIRETLYSFVEDGIPIIFSDNPYSI